MSIASEITSMGENLKKDYQSIANLGADLTNVDKNIENIAELLDGVYDRLPKTEFEKGESVTLENTLKGKLDFQDGKVGFGQASQESTTGTQRIDTNEYIAPTTKNGVTYSLENGLFTFNGTASAGFDIMLSNKVSLEAGAYTMAPSDESGSYTGVFGKYAYVAEVGAGNIIDGGQVRMVINKTLENDYNNKVQLHFYIANGAVFSNYKFKVNLVKGTYTAQTIPAWEQYTGGYASPSPNWEQQVKCVAGRNKLPTYEIKKFTASADAWCSLDGISNFYNQTNIAPSKVFCILKANQTYTISVYQKANTNNVQLVDYTGTVLLTGIETQAKQYMPSTDIKVYPRLKVTSSNTETYCYMQIEEGSQATPYLPYNTIEEVVSGKNLIPNNWKQGMISTSDGVTISENPYWVYTEDYIPIDNQFTVSFKETCMAGLFLYDENKNFIGFYQSFKTNPYATFNHPNQKYFRIGYNLSGTQEATTPTTIYNHEPMTEYGNVATTYEPYITPTSYQLSLGDIELNAIGNYKDELIYDVDEDKVYKNEKIKKVVYNGTENWSRSGGTTETVFVGALSISGVVDHNGLSNYFTHSNYTNANTFDVYNNGNNLALRFNISQISDVASLKTWLSTHNTEVYYQLATPRETEITDTTLINQVKALYNAHSNNGTTIITSNGNLPMIIKVRGLKGE